MDPERRPDLRVGDAEREQTLERLRAAHAEGRLDVDEFYGRLDTVYTARTYGDLDALVADLPPAGLTRFPPPPRPVSQPAPPVSGSASRPVPAARPDGIIGWLAAMPPQLRGIWLTWATVVSINVVVWTLIVVLSTDTPTFWPGWVAGPWGIVNLGMTAAWWFNRGQDGRPEIGPG